jgi:hypothetical protein
LLTRVIVVGVPAETAMQFSENLSAFATIRSFVPDGSHVAAV